MAKYGRPWGGQPAVQHARDSRVVHDREGLALLLEARDDRPRVHAGLDQLQGDALDEGLPALREEDGAEPALAQLREDPVRTDLVADLLEACVRRCTQAVERAEDRAVTGLGGLVGRVSGGARGHG